MTSFLSLTRRSMIVAPLLALGAAATSAGCHGPAPTATTQVAPLPARRIVNLHAFARMYGVVRWFHPSDAAAAVDWNRFAIDGVHRVIDAPDAASLRKALTELFAPIAPTAHIVAASEAFPDEPALHPASIAGLDVVAWEHKGYGDSAVASAYASKRRHRDRTVPMPGAPFASLSQTLDATPYRGARLRLRAKLRTDDVAHGQIWLRVDRGDAFGFFENMDGRPVTSAAWTAAEIVGPVAADATQIVFGTLLSPKGTTWYDDFELSVEAKDGTWKPIEIADPSFEGSDLSAWHAGIGRKGSAMLSGWDAGLDRTQPATGAASLRVTQVMQTLTAELFDDAPQPGETVDIELGSGLRARVPIALYSRNGHTIGDTSVAASHAPAPTATSQLDPVAGAADVIVAWNVLQHFWPYWDVVSADWNAELDRALADALDDESPDDHARTLRLLSAAAPDGHARVTCPGESKQLLPPFAVEQIEGQLVVTASDADAIHRGDVILSVDGRPATDVLAEKEALASGSPQWRRVRAQWGFASGLVGSKMALRVRRGGAEVEVTVPRVDHQTLEVAAHPPIDRLDDGVYYVDLGRAPIADINAIIDRLATAPGVVFDLRGYPKGNHDVLSHLLTRPDDSTTWMAIARVIRPDHATPTWSSTGWSMPVLQPHIQGRVAFLTGPRAISYAESVMGLVEHYHLGEIVGAATAGTNGDVAEIAEPTGCSSVFTGLRVTRSSGARHHLVGVQPTIPASRTIAGVIAGRDEVLEKGLAYVRGAR